MDTETQNIVEIDAKGRRLGTLATEVASILLGKDRADFARHTTVPITIKITNLSQMDIPEKKKGEIYQSYSGYPGGRNEETLEHLGERLGYTEVFRRSVKSMLPKNKLQSVRMKNLVLSE